MAAAAGADAAAEAGAVHSAPGAKADNLFKR